MADRCEISVAGEQMVALAEKALYWPAARTVFVADVHLGKDSAMVACSIPVPMGATRETLHRLSKVLQDTNAEQLVLLGDLWHAKAGRSDRTYEEFLKWREQHAEVEMLLIEGNHDVKSGPLTHDARVHEVPEPHGMGPFALCHFPQPHPSRYVLAGHIHPGVVMHGYGRQEIKLACFWFGRQTAVLPAFGEFTGSAKVSPVEGDQILIVAEGQICHAPVGGNVL